MPCPTVPTHRPAPETCRLCAPPIIAPLSETVQSILGENATRDLARWLEDAMREVTIPREEWNDARTRLAKVERDVELAGEFKQVAGEA